MQNEDYVAILYERLHEHRLIPLDGRDHITPTVRQWFGDSRGHWEGDTLVIVTTNFGEQVNFRGSTSGLHLTERFTRINDKTLRYGYTVKAAISGPYILASRFPCLSYWVICWLRFQLFLLCV